MLGQGWAAQPGKPKGWLESYQAEKAEWRREQAALRWACCAQPLFWMMICHLAHPYDSHGVGTSLKSVPTHSLGGWGRGG